jgi:hypothetical protein
MSTAHHIGRGRELSPVERCFRAEVVDRVEGRGLSRRAEAGEGADTGRDGETDAERDSAYFTGAAVSALRS